MTSDEKSKRRRISSDGTSSLITRNSALISSRSILGTTPFLPAVRSVILNEVMGSLEGKQWKLDVASFVRSLALARDDRGYFLSFHFSTTPCITPPISRIFSL